MVCNSAEQLLSTQWDNTDFRPALRKLFGKYLSLDVAEFEQAAEWLLDQDSFAKHQALCRGVLSIIEAAADVLHCVDMWLDCESGPEPWEDNPRRGLLMAISALQREPLDRITDGLSVQFDQLTANRGYSPEQLKLASQLSKTMNAADVARQVFPDEAATWTKADATKLGSAIGKAVRRRGLPWHLKRGRPPKK